MLRQTTLRRVLTTSAMILMATVVCLPFAHLQLGSEGMSYVAKLGCVMLVVATSVDFAVGGLAAGGPVVSMAATMTARTLLAFAALVVAKSAPGLVGFEEPLGIEHAIYFAPLYLAWVGADVVAAAIDQPAAGERTCSPASTIA
ncbi:hypothetical protein Mal64_03240 [Pseudobythopirellula maris]|uniref:Uncharacterized protein n=1 Tax=Pseudobythopirellula maris TaxID=2527991 RepID=A0A5C5ZQW1_9BACT|nr:hypothetical protein [Pseudobythopirellula maris]TWT89942.1 hypothetical protein Mal64_03240 [Pseudobythopirellula maris]